MESKSEETPRIFPVYSILKGEAWAPESIKEKLKTKDGNLLEEINNSIKRQIESNAAQHIKSRR